MATSVRKENRWKRTLRAINDEKQKPVIVIRNPRPAVPPPIPSATRQQVRRWMRNNASEYDNATALAEAANVEFLLPGNGLDDECHWIWEEAARYFD